MAFCAVSNIIDRINESVLTDNHLRISFDVIRVFSNIDHNAGFKSNKKALLDDNYDLDSINMLLMLLKFV